MSDLWKYGQPEPKYDSRQGEPNIYRPDVLKTIEEAIAEIDSELRGLSQDIHSHPEIKFEEKYAHDKLTEFMSVKGWKVTKNYILETGWKAEIHCGQGGRVLGVNSEMDALPGVGHACGHNLIAISGVAVALAARKALETHNIPGKVVLLGTPAEEGGSGKVYMIDEGGYKDMAACLMCHPGPGPPGSSGIGPSLAVQSIEVEYHGHTAHASAAPWEGINALDAAFLGYSAIGVLRQQVKPTHRIHGTVQGRDWAPNIIPDYAKMIWIVRAPSWRETEELSARVKKCLEAAATATGCTQEIKMGAYCYDIRQNETLINEYAHILDRRFGMTTNKSGGAIGGSTDFGNVTYVVPSIHPSFAIPTDENGGNHTPGFTKAAITSEAHKATLKVSAALALIGIRVLSDDQFYQTVLEHFKEGM